MNAVGKCGYNDAINPFCEKPDSRRKKRVSDPQAQNELMQTDNSTTKKVLRFFKAIWEAKNFYS